MNEDGLKLNGNHLLVYADYVNIMGGSLYTIEKNTEALVAGSKESGIQVIADKTKYTIMSRDENAGRSHSIKNYNSSFDMMEEFKYLGTSLTNQNCIQNEFQSSLTSGNACYQSVRNLPSSSKR